MLDEREQLAKEKDLQYIGLDGSVGIIANGAGLAMSTLDVVNQVGGSAANFLDIGGGANADVMAAALEVINYDENVRSIFINIFGGITRGEEVAKGIVEALGRVELRAPIVIRLDGTNAEEGRQIILDAGIPARKLISKPTMLEAAREAVAHRQRKRRGRLTMAIFVDADTKVIVQGLTGGQGKFHGLRNRDYGTQVVAGVTPGKGGQDVEGIPVFDSVAEAVAATGATASFVAVPPKAAPAAILEAAAAGIGFVVCITEGIPAQDEAKVYNTLVRDHPGTRLLGPNCPGIISPGKCNIGITPRDIAKLPSADGPNVGIVSRSGTLTYQALYELKQNGIGVSTCVGIGGDPVPGTSFVDCLAEFQADPETHAMIMFGEIGGSAEEEAAEFITANVTKPMSAYIAGVTAPAGKKMGHAGAIVSGGKGTAQGKMDALAAAGVQVGLNPTEAGELMAGLVAEALSRLPSARTGCRRGRLAGAQPGGGGTSSPRRAGHRRRVAAASSAAVVPRRRRSRRPAGRRQRAALGPVVQARRRRARRRGEEGDEHPGAAPERDAGCRCGRRRPEDQPQQHQQRGERRWPATVSRVHGIAPSLDQSAPRAGTRSRRRRRRAATPRRR